ncbi:MAG: putative oxidoreductase YhhX [Candidatus Moanabacter tarae]|uniref:Putative oxidoreductase YhhX n=1 Tax=Candidatus Moanibacter tarae TaxID=2200854 RepID=A0A2Z4AB28_9BACT|nr:MAG: putative oxidoreductase YhhX [Candidatus Moanabacter tarae]
MTQSHHGVLLVSGLRTHQENYGLLFQSDPRCRLVAMTDEADVGDERTNWNRALADQFDIPFVPDLDEALRMPGVDIVSVCAEPERRGRVVTKCARAGKHVYIDKPMTPYLATADDVVRTVHKAGVRSQMFSFINQAWCRRARSIVDSGELGELIAIHADWLFAKGHPGSADLTKRRVQPYPCERFSFIDSKAEFYAIGVYALGLVCWLARDRVSSVYGCTRNYFFDAHQKNGQEDFGFLSLKLGNGLVATVSGGRIGWSSHPASGENKVFLIGSKGSLCIDGNRMRLETFSNLAPWTPPEAHPGDPMGFWSSTNQEAAASPKESWAVLPLETNEPNDANHFVDCIENEKESEMNADAAAHLTEILLAGYKSAATGQVVDLPLEREE